MIFSWFPVAGVIGLQLFTWLVYTNLVATPGTRRLPFSVSTFRHRTYLVGLPYRKDTSAFLVINMADALICSKLPWWNNPDLNRSSWPRTRHATITPVTPSCHLNYTEAATWPARGDAHPRLSRLRRPSAFPRLPRAGRPPASPRRNNATAQGSRASQVSATRSLCPFLGCPQGA